MASALITLVTGQYLGVTATPLYTSPTGTWTQIVKLTCCNTGASTRVVNIYLVPNGAVAAGSNQSTKSQAILGGLTFNSPNEYGQVLSPGDALWAYADAASTVSIVCSGVAGT